MIVKAKRCKPSQGYLNSIFKYSKGKIFRKLKNSLTRAGYKNGSDPYRRVSVGGIYYYEHKIIFRMLTGLWPDVVHHIIDDLNSEGIKSNYISNLEKSDRIHNLNKSRKITQKSSIYKGVSFINKSKKWRAEIFSGGVSHYLGEFNIELDAAICYDQNKIKIYGNDGYLNFGKDAYLKGGKYYNLPILKSDKRISSSKYRGVHAKRNKWVASVKYKNKRYHLGTFKTQQEAALKYDLFVIQNNLPLEYLNFNNFIQ